MGILDNSFDRMFDFDGDGELDPIERFAQFEFMEEEGDEDEDNLEEDW